MTTTLLVRKDRPGEARLAAADDAALDAGQVRVRVERFALTANNVTYAAFGDAMQYWRFFPSAEEGWGVVPVWGFGTVVQSAHAGVAVGERLWGYWPMAGSAVLQPRKLSPEGFADGAPHRAELHPVYNFYARCNADPFYSADSEDLQALLRPLFTTSWLIDDFPADRQFFGARRVLLSSASSKTAYGTAFQLRQREGIELVGLTSAANRAFCESLGCYDRVLAYEDFAQLDPAVPSVYVDFAGNARFRKTVHEQLADLRYDCAVGGTHVAELGGGADLPGPRPTLFFAPAHAKKRQQEWGLDAFNRRLLAGWQAFRDRAGDPAAPWLRVRTSEGADAALQAWQQLAAGGTEPAAGHIVALRG
ncbi:DUF2855 family protein [Ramlibacter terrae]|uniref:DUF2855 family protein n=1 Tax=Ramlibacter terrae TaxID=2732511 RepID=A0ABX6P0G7_9BURK|nr:DUF2855 family protein [Ramlibacter terrae]